MTDDELTAKAQTNYEICAHGWPNPTAWAKLTEDQRRFWIERTRSAKGQA